MVSLDLIFVYNIIQQAKTLQRSPRQAPSDLVILNPQNDLVDQRWLLGFGSLPNIKLVKHQVGIPIETYGQLGRPIKQELKQPLPQLVIS